MRTAVTVAYTVAFSSRLELTTAKVVVDLLVVLLVNLNKSCDS